MFYEFAVAPLPRCFVSVTPVNGRLLRALARQPIDITPVWLMRQAGRYLPEYGTTRAKAGSFMALCRNPNLATEVALQPLARFALDAAILFSDILTIPDAMGLGLDFLDGEGPRFARPVQDEAAILKLRGPDLADLQYVFDAVSQIRRALANRLPLIGFAGSPFTLACYMIEGGGSADFARARRMLYTRPDLLHHLLNILADAVAAYLSAQIEAGAQVIMLFDTWGGILSSSAFREFSLAYLKQVLDRLNSFPNCAQIPTIVFVKGAGGWLPEIAAAGFDCVGLDWTTDLRAARKQIGDAVALQGNLDPHVLLTSPDLVSREVVRVLAENEDRPGHIFNLGHGILPTTPPENVAALVETVHAYRPGRQRLRG